MLKNIYSLGKTLNRQEQQSINGGVNPNDPVQYDYCHNPDGADPFCGCICDDYGIHKEPGCDGITHPDC